MMQEYIICKKEDLVAMADAVREATGDVETYSVPELRDALINSYKNFSGIATMQPLTFTGIVDAVYDGSKAVNVEIPKMEVEINDLKQLKMLIDADMLPAVYATSGAILTDGNGKIILRY